MNLNFKQLSLNPKHGIGLTVLALITIVSVALVFILTKQPATAPKFDPPVRTNRWFAPDNVLLSKPLAQAHLLYRIETKLPVVFLTMDDGMYKDPRAIEFINRRQWPVSLFLTDKYAKSDYEYFKKLTSGGSMVQNHTLSHVFLTNQPYEQQKNEICAASDKAGQVFGKRPNLLRPPGGFFDSNTLIASHECGIKAVVMWSAKVDGGMVQFQRNDRLVPGDIVLMHFRPKIMEDLAAFEAEIIKQGLYVARLEDWIRVEP